MKRNRRRGMTLLETAAAAFILAVGVVGVAQVVALAATQRREAERRQIATTEAANLMERIAALPWEDVQPARLESFTLSARARQVLPEAQLRAEVEEVASKDDAIPTKRISVAISWTAKSGERASPARLVAWRYPMREARR